MTGQILYESTNRNLTLDRLLRIKNVDPDIKGPFTDLVSFTDAIIQGQAPDTGLFVPQGLVFPQITLEEIASLKGRPFADAAYLVYRKFLAGEQLSDSNLRKLVDETFTFDYPIRQLDPFHWLLMHTMSPTGDFKNTGARSNARFYKSTRPPGISYIRITSTSGDTGGAVALADLGIPGLISVVLYPLGEKGRISPVQEMIIKSIGGNTLAVGVEEATFTPIQDDIAKVAFADNELKRELMQKYQFGLTSGNSINWGRVMPQIVHYVYAYAQVADKAGEPVIFSTPLGNMGHGYAGEMARRMGLPIFSVWPTNENDPFPRYMDSGIYKPLTTEEAKACKSCSMNVRNPSNLARLFYSFDGQADKDGNVNKYPDREKIKQHIYSPRVSSEEEDQTIVDVFRLSGEKIIIEPHGACGVNGLWQAREAKVIPPDVKCVTQITANPYKFKGHVEGLLHRAGFTSVEIPKPKAYKWFDKRPQKGITMPFSYEHFRDLLLDIAKNPDNYNMMH